MKIEQKTTATVRMRPVCECGHVFHKLYVHEETATFLSGHQIKKYRFEPSLCPNCGKVIDGVDSIPIDHLLQGEDYE